LGTVLRHREKIPATGDSLRLSTDSELISVLLDADRVRQTRRPTTMRFDR
jgi:hypothetical protein